MTYYEIPGMDKVDLALYVKDERTGKSHTGQVIYAVYGEGEDPLKAHSVVAFRNKNSIYKAAWTYEQHGLYWLRVRFKDGPSTVEELFRLQIGDQTLNYWYLGASGGGVVLLIVAVAVIKKVRSPGIGDAAPPESS